MAAVGRSRRRPPRRAEDEPIFPWARSDYQNRLLKTVREYAPELLEQLEVECTTPDPTLRSRAIAAVAARWDLTAPWVVATMDRTVRIWLRAPRMRQARQWGPALPSNGWGHPKWDSRRAVQYRGMKPSPEDKTREVRAFTWWVRYHVCRDTFSAIAAADGVEPATIRMAVDRLSQALEIPRRPGTRGRPRKPTV